jgi:thiol-disulfide isomerase/thioredoxin
MIKILMIVLLSIVAITAQDINKTLMDSTSGKPILIGLANREAFIDTNFAWWFDSGYKFYRPDTNAIADLKEVSKDYTITIVMGTWCSDSRREVPRFYKILDELNYSDENLKLINVDRDKIGIDNGVDSLNIELVPTFIIYSEEKEIGRIIETPNESLEKDMSKILSAD